MALHGCSGKVDSFYLTLPENGRTVVREYPDRKPAEEGFLTKGRSGQYESSRYFTKKPIHLDDGMQFFVRYQSSAPLSIIVEHERGEEGLYVLSPTAGFPRDQFIIPDARNGITSFRFISDSGDVRILGGGIDRDFPGYSADGTHETVGARVRIIKSSMDGRESRIYRFVPYDPAQGAGVVSGEYVLSVSYRYDGAHFSSESPSIPVSVRGQGYSADSFFRPDRGEGSFLVYPASVGFLPLEIEIPTDTPGFGIGEVTWTPVSSKVSQPTWPIPADLACIIDYSPAYWRNNRFEVFSWHYIPQVLIIDFMDYATQSDFLKRMSFFVEKKGYAGEIPAYEEVAALHDWNAHDYRAEDLARFYRKAERENTPLTAGESTLLDILTENGVLIRRDGGVLAGEGALLSICRDTPERLRRVFLGHEAFHGIFFTNAAFAGQVRALWERAYEEERWFWKVFLDSKEYNTADSYLVINEFQAYLLQQPAAEADGYYIDYIIPRLLAQNGALREEIDLFLEQHPEPFSARARELERILEDYAGFSDTRLVSRTRFLEGSD